MDRIQPIVLVGGKSRRFGRDKLREPVEDRMLVERPIDALRQVFGPRVAVVGECDAAVARMGDLVIRDRYPGVGPAGGILSALEHIAETPRDSVTTSSITAAGGPMAVFVLAGDLARVHRSLVQTLVDAAAADPLADTVLAATGDHIEPCIGIYRYTAAAPLRLLVAGVHDREHERERSLRSAIAHMRIARVAVDPAMTLNVNRPDDLSL
jgi:molybdopterin-guanine dinucleotide biosynthesis protein A